MNIIKEIYQKLLELKQAKPLLFWLLLAVLAYFLFIIGSIILQVGLHIAKVVSIAVTDYWWFTDIGLTQTFIKTLGIHFFVGALSVGYFFALFTIIYRSVHSTTPWAIQIGHNKMQVSGTWIQRLLIVIGFLISSSFAFSEYTFIREKGIDESIIKFFSSVPFGYTDPIFHYDISFFVFSLPFINIILGLFSSLILASFICTWVIHFLKGEVVIRFLKFTLRMPRVNLDGTDVSTSIATHRMNTLFFLFFSSWAIGRYLEMLSLLYSDDPTRSKFIGPSYFDVKLGIPLGYAALTVLVAISLSTIVFIIKHKPYPFVRVFIFLIIINGIVPNIASLMFQKIYVIPNERSLEQPYITHNIASTVEAYNLKNINEIQLSQEKELTGKDIEKYLPTFKNVRLWDRDKLLAAYSQLQEIRTYYSFLHVDDDRYMIGGEPRQVMISPRQLFSYKLGNLTWINRKLVYTHGYGLTASFANEATSSGLPNLIVKDMPIHTDVDTLRVNRPQIYFGDIGTEEDDYVIVDTNTKEFDYPNESEAGGVFTRYTESNGVTLDSLFKKIMYAVRFGIWDFVTNRDITYKSRLLLHRDILRRVNAIAPFLTYDNDPYLVVSNGRIYWILDAYTTSDTYPYATFSQFTPDSNRFNYVRNSVKIVIDAYNGKTTFYLFDDTDPLARSYARLFPELFVSIDKFPKDLHAHLRYPELLFNVQAGMYEKYHVQNTEAFYRGEDFWQQAKTIDESPVGSRHVIMTLPQGDRPEFILYTAFTPVDKNNLSSWIAVRNDLNNYGKLFVYRFPKDRLVYGPKLATSLMDQNEEISKLVTLLDQKGSRVEWGSVFALPIENSVLYIRPMYIRSEGVGSIPELKRIVVTYNDTVVMDENLDNALKKLFPPINRVDQIQIATPSSQIPTL